MLVKKMFKASMVLAMAAMLSACASGTKLSALEPGTLDITQGKSQIVVYRDSILGAAYRPTVSLDGRETGECTAKGVFVIDVDPETEYELTASLENTAELQVSVPANERVYVRCSIGFGLVLGRVKMEIVHNATGESESANLSYTGKF